MPATERIDYGSLLALFARLIPDAGERQALFCDTPLRLFGFGWG
jgi:predicted TIM-barrel fold metal-dependent hydrolase